jgi:ethanolamine utilization cobalamin adenosyltransferase
MTQLMFINNIYRSFTILEQIHVQKLVSVVKEKLANRQEEAWSKDLKKHLHVFRHRHRGLNHTRH